MNNVTDKENTMSKQEVITLNGKKYVEYDESQKDIKPAVETDHIIVIAQRGWIFEGHRDKSVKNEIKLLSANVVRSWTGGKGIGGLCKTQYKGNYTLDEVGTMHFPAEAVIATIDITEW